VSAARSLAPLTLEGANIVLRELGPDDVTARYVGWLNDPVVNASSSRLGTTASEADCRDYLSSLAVDEVVLGISAPDAGHVGNVKFGPIDRRDSRADISILIGERNVWGRGIGREAVYLVTRHLFGEENLNRVDAGSGNPAFIRMVQGLGWQIEGVLRERVRIGDRLLDWTLVAQLRREFVELPQYRAVADPKAI